MPGNPHDMITMADRHFPARIRIAVPPGGFGQRYTEMTAWLERKLRRGRVGDDAVRNTRRAE
jgi:hypothetical protein